ncbi:hypothetical protein [Streptomyces sp. NPDC053079]|uniref:hypothetical protein n=1 Tax=Streptomyces sp. NPDC053079 TaxID=3365697 RepID=UPI0037D56662
MSITENRWNGMKFHQISTVQLSPSSAPHSGQMAADKAEQPAGPSRYTGTAQRDPASAAEMTPMIPAGAGRSLRVRILTRFSPRATETHKRPEARL